jgi:dipeptidyl aminopeptidase/acylaminoacyl peptidase
MDEDKTTAIADGSSNWARKWFRRAGMIALGAVGSVTVAIGAASFPLSGLLVRPKLKRLSHLRRPHIKNFMKKQELEYEEIIIPSFDGLKLRGWWMEAAPEAATVVVLHGVTKNRTQVLRAAITLRRAGFNVLVFDGRGHGQSEGRHITYGFHERRDVEAALEWLVTEKKVDVERIGLAGESMGAAISLQVAAHCTSVKAVWADSPFASLRRVTKEYVSRITRLPRALLDPVLWPAFQVANYRGKFDISMVEPLALAKQIKCPVYLIHGTADDLISTDHSQNIYDALETKKELWIVEGARHARSIRHSRKEYSERLVKFFKENLNESTKSTKS